MSDKIDKKMRKSLFSEFILSGMSNKYFTYFDNNIPYRRRVKLIRDEFGDE